MGRLLTFAMPLVGVSLASTMTLAAAQGGQRRPPQPPPVKPASTPAPAAPAQAPGSSQVCDYITIDEAKLLLGDDATAVTAPSKGLFTSCGYTSPHGEALTLSIADYGIPFVAQQFFEKTRDALKTTAADDTFGAPAYVHSSATMAPVTATPPANAAGGAPPRGAAPSSTPASPTPALPPGSIPTLTITVVKDHRIVKLEAAGPIVATPPQIPRLRAVVTRVLATLPALPPPADEPADAVPPAAAPKPKPR